MAGAGVISGITAVVEGSESQLVNSLFKYGTTLEDFKRLMQLTEITPDLIFPTLVMGLLQRKYKSRTLKDALEIFFLLEVAKDRKGRDDFLEVATAMRRAAAEGSEE